MLVSNFLFSPLCETSYKLEDVMSAVDCPCDESVSPEYMHHGLPYAYELRLVGITRLVVVC